MKITAEQLDMLKEMYNVPAKITFEDLFYPNQAAAGTRVRLEMPSSSTTSPTAET